MSNIQQQLESISKKSMEKAEKVVRETYFEVFNRTILRSPVDTGVFRGSWLAGLKLDESIPRTVQDSSGRLVFSLDNAGDALLFKPFYFVNNQRYAKKLEDGNSQQAPRGMVKIGAAEFETIAQQKINEIRLT